VPTPPLDRSYVYEPAFVDDAAAADIAA